MEHFCFCRPWQLRVLNSEMQLTCDLSVASSYTSPAQRARVISECWFASNSYCLACDSNFLQRLSPNTIATDFSCPNCQHCYELKTFLRRPRKSLVDGAYATLMHRISSGSAPTLCLLERNPSWQIQSLTAVHSSFLTPWVIEERPPLGAHARRAGWIGCNIRLDRIPPDGEVKLIEGGIVFPKVEIRRRFQRFLPLANLPVEKRGWTTLTLKVARTLGSRAFSLGDLYAKEAEFVAAYPRNRHVREKIRQQLQVLRDLGVLSFKGKGRYLIMD